MNTVGYTLGGTNLTVDPLLTPDFHLTAGSPMRDAGIRSAANIDLDGEPRVMTGPSGFFRADIGADETTGTAQLVVIFLTFMMMRQIGGNPFRQSERAVTPAVQRNLERKFNVATPFT